ncbi:hypothetical protein BASA83_006677 [Batrachochytrium salamandrivorans]|nr:hypothetical protein BASA83_006677 [Batrachochytrium salamandrivorans]
MISGKYREIAAKYIRRHVYVNLAIRQWVHKSTPIILDKIKDIYGEDEYSKEGPEITEKIKKWEDKSRERSIEIIATTTKILNKSGSVSNNLKKIGLSFQTTLGGCMDLIWKLVNLVRHSSRGQTLMNLFRRRPTSKASTKTVYEWIQPSKETSTSTSVEDSADIGLSYILQKLNLRSNEFKVMKNFTDRFGVTHVYGVPLYLRFPIGNLYAAVHVTNGQWIEVKVDANTGDIVSSQDFKRGFTYTAIKLPNENARGGVSEILSPENIQSSLKETDTASFLAPPDGQSGVLDLHIYTATEPNRDPALDNNVMIHELTQGLSTRLTGGAHEDMCMSKIESGGLGEGYSDMVALIFTAKPEDTRNTKKVIGEYVQGDPRGGRRYPYTTNMRFNPLTYKDAVGEKDPYRLGEIWASLLWEVYWNLVDAYGFSANLHDAKQEKGNIIFLQILVGTMMIQPCNPTFKSARDAMLAADDVYYGGIHEHLIRQGFAKRGIGSIS